MTNPSKPGRRRLLQVLAAIVASTMATRSFAEAGMLLTRPIPSSAEALPVVGLGTYQSFGVGSNEAEREPLQQVLRLFVEQGGRLIDSSPMYGTAESVRSEEHTSELQS